MKPDSRVTFTMALLVAALVLGWIFTRLTARDPSVLRDGSTQLNEVKINLPDRDDTPLAPSTLAFDLDKYQPADAIEAERIAAMKNARATLACAERLQEGFDDYAADRNSKAGQLFNRAMFYRSKGELEKAVRALVHASKETIRTDWFKSEIFQQLAQMYAELGIEKQRLKALVRFYELQEANARDPFKQKEFAATLKEMRQQLELASDNGGGQ